MAENRALIPDPVAMYTKPETLTDAKDLSKNLVSGDFERQYRAGVMEKPGRRRTTLTIVGVAVGALACWLLVLTVLREMQITALRNDVDMLKANAMVLQAKVKSLSEKLTNEFRSEFMEDDAIYSDGDNSFSLDEHTRTEDDDSAELDAITEILPNDDDDLEDGDDDEESGDWYTEYDQRRPKNGISSMVKLKPEDFTDSIVNLGKVQQTKVMELKRQINENPENPDIGIPSLAGSASETRNKRSVFPEASQESADQIAPRAFSKVEERRKTKKFTPGVDDPLNKLALHAVTRTVRSDGEGASRGRPFIAAHFHGNTSHLNTETHEHYKGNGLLRVAHDKPHDVWYPSPWTIASPHPRPTLTRNGHVHVHHTGVYLVYVQIYYLDSHDVISWVLHRTNAEIEGRETLMQCAQSAHTPEPMDKPNSCFSAAALFLKAGDRLAVRNTGGDRHSLMQPEKSFIGLIKLADAEDPNADEL